MIKAAAFNRQTAASSSSQKLLRGHLNAFTQPSYIFLNHRVQSGRQALRLSDRLPGR